MEIDKLHKDEICYELLIRGQKSLGNNRSNLIALRQIWHKPILDVKYPDIPLGEELVKCYDKVEDLISIFSKFRGDQTHPDFILLDVRSQHILNRLKNLIFYDQETLDGSGKTDLVDKLKTLRKHFK